MHYWRPSPPSLSVLPAAKAAHNAQPGWLPVHPPHPTPGPAEDTGSHPDATNYHSAPASFNAG